MALSALHCPGSDRLQWLVRQDHTQALFEIEGCSFSQTVFCDLNMKDEKHCAPNNDMVLSASRVANADGIDQKVYESYVLLYFDYFWVVI